MDERIVIPPNEAGQRIFAVMSAVAERVYKTAKASTAAYIQAEMPTAKTLSESHADGKYCVTVRVPHRKKQMLTYDYSTREVTLGEVIIA